MRIQHLPAWATAIFIGIAASAQGVRPETPQFNASVMNMQGAPGEGVVVRAGRMFDPRTAKNLANQVIVIQGDRIADVGPAGSVSVPPRARVIDLSNATVLPGLIDRHVHLFQDQQPNDARAALMGANYALKDLYAGFTTIQDMGSPYTYASVELRDAIETGLAPGPTMQVAGLQLNPRAATPYPARSTVSPLVKGVWQL